MGNIIISLIYHMIIKQIVDKYKMYINIDA